MTSEKRNILNRLLQVWPHGSVAVTPWLKSQGVSQQLVHEYEKSGWVRRVGRGAYLRAGEVVEWSGGLNAVQNQLGLPIHVSDKTALQLQGYAHFLPLGKGGTLSFHFLGCLEPACRLGLRNVTGVWPFGIPPPGFFPAILVLD